MNIRHPQDEPEGDSTNDNYYKREIQLDVVLKKTNIKSRLQEDVIKTSYLITVF